MELLIDKTNQGISAFVACEHKVEGFGRAEILKKMCLVSYNNTAHKI